MRCFAGINLISFHVFDEIMILAFLYLLEKHVLEHQDIITVRAPQAAGCCYESRHDLDATLFSAQGSTNIQAGS